jgi:hypothetical protein
MYEILQEMQFNAFCALWCMICKLYGCRGCERFEFRSNFNEHKYVNNVSHLNIM